jgi:hypothetical protein
MKANVFAICAVVCGCLLASPCIAVGQEGNAGSKLEVHVKYSGTGTVDDKHKIYVALWDSPDFANKDMVPSAVQATSSKDGMVTFDHVTKTQVYVSAAYDPSGQWDAQSAPPEGSSLGLYSKTPGTPAPIDFKPRRKTAIDLAFDDSVKMKGGKATHMTTSGQE